MTKLSHLQDLQGHDVRYKYLYVQFRCSMGEKTLTGGRNLYFKLQGCVNVIVFSPSGDKLASGSDDGKVRLWNPYTFTCIRTMQYV